MGATEIFRSGTHPRPLIVSMPPLSRDHHPPTAGDRPQLTAAASIEATEEPQQLLADGIKALAESLEAHLRFLTGTVHSPKERGRVNGLAPVCFEGAEQLSG